MIANCQARIDVTLRRRNVICPHSSIIGAEAGKVAIFEEGWPLANEKYSCGLIYSKTRNYQIIVVSLVSIWH